MISNPWLTLCYTIPTNIFSFLKTNFMFWVTFESHIICKCFQMDEATFSVCDRGLRYIVCYPYAEKQLESWLQYQKMNSLMVAYNVDETVFKIVSF